MNTRTVAWVTAFALLLSLGWVYERGRITSAPAAAAPAVAPPWSTSLSRLGVRLAAMQCPPDMPECAATPRQRYRKWARGTYGSVRAAEAVEYGKALRRKIIRRASSVFHHRYPNRNFHKRAKWRRFTGRDRCVGGPYIWNGERLVWKRVCSHRWYNDSTWGGARKFVRGITLCEGEIALAIIGAKGMGRAWGGTLVAGTGSLCAHNQWDRMPPARGG